MRPSSLLKLASVTLLAISLGGCITLLPKSRPSQLYRFGVEAAAPPAPPNQISVFRAAGYFQREASGDRLLTMTGERAAYIAEARWVAPAEVLFDEAVVNAFEARPGRVRLVSRGEPQKADMALRLDVRNFETRYDDRSAPVVVVRVRALMLRNHAPVAEQIFEAQAPADRNRVTAIVAAYDQALAKVLGDVVAWTDNSAA